MNKYEKIEDEIIKNLKDLRERNNLSRRQCSLNCGLSPSCTSNIERKETHLGFLVLIKYTKYYDIDILQLVGLKDKDYTPEQAARLFIIKLKILRESELLSQNEFVVKSNIKQPLLSRMENLEHINTKVINIIKYLDALGIDILKIFNNNKEEERKILQYEEGFNQLLSIVGGI